MIYSKCWKKIKLPVKNILCIKVALLKWRRERLSQTSKSWGSSWPLDLIYKKCWSSQVALVVKNPLANAGDVIDVGLIPGWGRCPGEGHATYSSSLAWRIPRTEEPGGLRSVGSQRVIHDWSNFRNKQTNKQNHSQRNLQTEIKG